MRYLLALFLFVAPTSVHNRGIDKHSHTSLWVRNDMQKIGICKFEEAIKKLGADEYVKTFDLKFSRQYNFWCGYASHDVWD